MSTGRTGPGGSSGGWKDTVRPWLPPAALDLARRVRKPPAPGWSYVPEGWPAAGRYSGWDVESVTATQVANWPGYLRGIEGVGPLGLPTESTRLDQHRTDGPDLPGYAYASHNAIVTFGYVLARTAHDRDRVSVLDWGGGLGYHAPLARALLPEVEIDYHCHDLPLVCRAGEELQPDVTFHEDADTALARRYDLVLVSNALQYFEDTRELLGQLAAATDRHLLLTRVPIVWNVPSYVVAQHPIRFGYDTEYLSWTFNRGALLAHADAVGLELVREFLLLERQHVPDVPEQWENRAFLFAPGSRPG